tara:strand:+ start:284 stop:430 length:147 start_codon:yes stop_codon:yes gene_type:complete
MKRVYTYSEVIEILQSATCEEEGILNNHIDGEKESCEQWLAFRGDSFR